MTEEKNEIYEVAIIGAGPSGLSAAGRAAELNMKHVLLEKNGKIANTIRSYQKGKRVMAEPPESRLRKRSPIDFYLAKREEVLETWENNVSELRINLHLSSEVIEISGKKGNFLITLNENELSPALIEQGFQAESSEIHAKNVVIAIGDQSNINKLTIPDSDELIPGENFEQCVRYSLDDPENEIYRGKTIVVIGGSDSAVENAVSLSEQKDVEVHIVYRGNAFHRPKPLNQTELRRKIQRNLITDHLGTQPVAVVESDNTDGKPYLLKVMTGDKENTIPCDLVIARLGASAPVELLQKWGVTFSGENTDNKSQKRKKDIGKPLINKRYECIGKPGLYVIGTLADAPLIKYALNQGYDVIEGIRGAETRPVDEEELVDKLLFGTIPDALSVEDALELIREKFTLFQDSKIVERQMRELFLASDFLQCVPDQKIFEKDTYDLHFYLVFSGEVEINYYYQTEESLVKTSSFIVGAGDFFGVTSLISSNKQTCDAFVKKKGLVIRIPNADMQRLSGSVKSIEKKLNDAFTLDIIRERLLPEASLDKNDLLELVRGVEIKRLKTGELLYKEETTNLDKGTDDALDSATFIMMNSPLFIIRRGSVTVSRALGRQEITLDYLTAGNYVGEIEAIRGGGRLTTVRANVPTEVLTIPSNLLKLLITTHVPLLSRLTAQSHDRLLRYMQVQQGADDRNRIMPWLLEQRGIGEATDVLLIDEKLCIYCDHCEKACADTHDGIARFERKQGPSYASIHLTNACRHCDHPHCMSDCPPNAIWRDKNGEVYIQYTGDNKCIGCENCKNNCPYGAIQMSPLPDKPPKNRLLQWVMFGWGEEPGTQKVKNGDKSAVKCDMCKDLSGNVSACVSACPTGAAVRIHPHELSDYLRLKAN